jgi:hypothetical protein
VCFFEQEQEGSEDDYVSAASPLVGDDYTDDDIGGLGCEGGGDKGGGDGAWTSVNGKRCSDLQSYCPMVGSFYANTDDPNFEDQDVMSADNRKAKDVCCICQLPAAELSTRRLRELNRASTPRLRGSN